MTTGGIAFFPDGRRLISASGDGTARIWKPGLPEHVTVLSGHAGRIDAVEVLADQRTIASASADGSVRLWDSATGGSTVLLEQDGGVFSLAASASGSTLLAGTHDGTVQVWNLVTRQQDAAIPAHRSPVLSLSFSPDGKQFVSGGVDRTAGVWRLDGLQNEFTIDQHEAGVRAVAWSPDGLTIATGSMDGRILLVDAADGAVRADQQAHSEGVKCVSVFDGRPSAGVRRDGRQCASVERRNRRTRQHAARTHGCGQFRSIRSKRTPARVRRPPTRKSASGTWQPEKSQAACTDTAAS